MKTVSVLTAALMLAGCVTEQHERAQELLGTWEPTMIMLEGENLSELDPMGDLFYADTNNWDRVMGMKPFRTTYKEDGTFEAEYRNLKDSVYTIARGTWYTDGDSLHFFQVEPDTFRAVWEFSVAMDTLHLRGMAEWDRDGKLNDKYTGTQKKLP